MDDYVPYSKRRLRIERGEVPTIYAYDELPATMRTQAFNALSDGIGVDEIPLPAMFGPSPVVKTWKAIEAAAADALGLPVLPADGDTPRLRFYMYLLRDANDTIALDMIEIGFHTMMARIPPPSALVPRPGDPAASAVRRLNRRFDEHSLGYQLAEDSSGWVLIRRDSEFLHEEVVGPTLTLLHLEGFKGALDEFLGAHKHYREGRSDSAVNEALKAFESTMKTICEREGWALPDPPTAHRLIDKMIVNKLFPKSLTSELGSLRTLLESGLPAIRNSTTAHGQGDRVFEVPDYIVAYALHLAAANIVLLLSAYRQRSETSGTGQSDSD